MIDYEEFIEPEWLDWYRKTPEERLNATSEAWDIYLSLGGTLDPDPDPQSPFWSREEIVEFAKTAAKASERVLEISNRNS